MIAYINSKHNLKSIIIIAPCIDLALCVAETLVNKESRFLEGLKEVYGKFTIHKLSSMCAVDNPQLAADNPHKKAVAWGTTAGENVK